MLLTGFLKSTIGTGLISLGMLILFTSISQPDSYATHAPIVGIVLIIAGCIIYLIGDIYKMIQKKNELTIINDVMDQKIQDNAITEAKAREIAKKLVDKELRELEHDLCDDPETSCHDK